MLNFIPTFGAANTVELFPNSEYAFSYARQMSNTRADTDKVIDVLGTQYDPTQYAALGQDLRVHGIIDQSGKGNDGTYANQGNGVDTHAKFLAGTIEQRVINQTGTASRLTLNVPISIPNGTAYTLAAVVTGSETIPIAGNHGAASGHHTRATGSTRVFTKWEGQDRAIFNAVLSDATPRLLVIVGDSGTNLKVYLNGVLVPTERNDVSYNIDITDVHNSYVSNNDAGSGMIETMLWKEEFDQTKVTSYYNHINSKYQGILV